MLTFLLIANIISISISLYGLFYINKYTNTFGPIKTLNLIFISFLVVGIAHLTPLKYFLHEHHTTLLPFFQFLILTVYIVEIKVIKFQGDWLPSDILNNLPDMLWIKDKKGRFLYANDATCKQLLLLDKKNVIGKTGFEISEINDAKGLENTFCDICNDTDNLVLSEKRARKFLEVGKINDKFLAIQVVKAPVYDKKGNIKGTVGCGRDLTCAFLDHAKLQKLYENENFIDFEKLFEKHKYRYLVIERDQCKHCTEFEKNTKV